MAGEGARFKAERPRLKLECETACMASRNRQQLLETLVAATPLT